MMLAVPSSESSSPRVLMFATAFAPYMSSASLNNSKLALAMLNRGWRLDVVSGALENPMYGATWQEPWLPLKPITCEVRYPHGTRVMRTLKQLAQAIYLGHPIPGLRWAYAALQAALRLHAQQPYDVVLSRYLNHNTHLAALAFARRTGVPWIANWNDPTGDSFPPPYDYGQRLPQRILCDRYYRAVAARADFNTFPCQRLAEHMLKPLALPDMRRVRVIPHIGLEGYEPRKKISTDVFTLCHAGNLSAERNPETLLTAVRRLLDEEKPRRPIRLEIIGVEEVKVGRLVDALNLREIVTFLGTMHYLASLERLASSSVVVIVEAPCREGIFLPGKLADYATVRRPILSLSPPVGTVRDMISQHGGGVVADCACVESTYSALRTLYEAWCRDSLEGYISQSLCRAMSGDIALAKYRELFTCLGVGN
jgi:glycosyltransferase involved in cell wall biosynthesis